MLVVKKNQIIVTALLVVVAIAGYISYTDKTHLDYASQFEEVGDGVAVEANGTNTEEDESLGDAVFTAISSDESLEQAQGKQPESNTESAPQQQGEEKAQDSQETAAIIEQGKDDYFVAEKLVRDKDYQQKLSQRTSILSNEAISQEEKKQVVAAMAAMDTNYQKAVDTERLLKGRGFEETLVTFGANGNINVDVSTKGKELTRKDVANIKSVVMMQTGTTEDKIVIHPMN